MVGPVVWAEQSPGPGLLGIWPGRGGGGRHLETVQGGPGHGEWEPPLPRTPGPMGFPAAGVTAKRRGQTKISAGGGSDRQGRGRGDRKLPGEQGRLHFRKGAGRQQEEWRDGPAWKPGGRLADLGED